MAFDLTRSPIREGVFFDAFVCDRDSPLSARNSLLAPYGVRAGAKKLGSKKDMSVPVTRRDGAIAHM